MPTKASIAKRLEKIELELARMQKQKRSLEEQAEWDKCAGDIKFWCNKYVWTYDPRLSDKNRFLPFNLFKRQEDYLDWLEAREIEREDGLVEKSRDVGISWLSVVFALHRWIFRTAYNVIFMSRKQELVDQLGNPGSLLGKFRLALQRLPPWMIPKYDSNYMRIINLENESIVTGEIGDNAGRGNRSSIYFADEWAFVERSETVDAALSYASDCKIYLSTPNGIGNSFYKKRFGGIIPVFTFWWHQDPRKDQAWYDREKEKATDPAKFAQEVDLDYHSSLEGQFIPYKYVMAAAQLQREYDITGGRRQAGLDVGVSGISCYICIEEWKVCNIEDWRGLDTTDTAYKSLNMAIADDAKSLCYDSNAVGEGVSSTLNRSETQGVKLIPFKGSWKPTRAWWESENRSSREKFLNARSESWGLVKERLRKTWEFIEKGIEHPFNEMLGLPDRPKLFQELCSVTGRYTTAGKIQLESKQDMKKRGVDSPNEADALAYACWNAPEFDDGDSYSGNIPTTY